MNIALQHAFYRTIDRNQCDTSVISPNSIVLAIDCPFFFYFIFFSVYFFPSFRSNHNLIRSFFFSHYYLRVFSVISATLEIFDMVTTPIKRKDGIFALVVRNRRNSLWWLCGYLIGNNVFTWKSFPRRF